MRPAAGYGSCRPASSSPANRRLKPRAASCGEEAGTSAQNWQSLGVYVSSPGVFTEIVHLYLAQELDSVKMAHEAAELIEVHWVELEDACTRALHGDINDGKTALGLLRARSLLQSSQARAS